jgi:hypothetical protein
MGDILRFPNFSQSTYEAMQVPDIVAVRSPVSKRGMRGGLCWEWIDTRFRFTVQASERNYQDNKLFNEDYMSKGLMWSRVISGSRVSYAIATRCITLWIRLRGHFRGKVRVEGRRAFFAQQPLSLYLSLYLSWPENLWSVHVVKLNRDHIRMRRWRDREQSIKPQPSALRSSCEVGIQQSRSLCNAL